MSLKKNSIISTISLFFQSGYSALLGFGAHFYLTILLTPEVFGIYFLVLSFISILNYCSDIGLSASLVQKKQITDDDIKTTFTIQQILIIFLISLGFLLSPFIQNAYKLPINGLYLYWALLTSFFMSSLKTIPSILLERTIQFQKIVMVQIIENTVFYASVVILAYLKFGLQSFTYAVLIRSFVGLVAIYILSPWIPRIGIVKKNMKELLAFGAPLQLSSLLALVKDDLVNLYLGFVLTPTQLGYIAWAKKYSEATLRIVMDNVNKILFPLLSRLQHDHNKIGWIIEKNLFFQTFLLAPSMLGFALLMSNAVNLIPNYQAKWAAAVPLFYMLSVSSFFSSYSSPFINMFYALGKVKTSLGYMIYWTAATWILTPILTKLFGLYGFPLTQMLLSLTFIAIIIQSKKLIKFNFFQQTTPFLISSIIMGICVYITKISLPLNWWTTNLSILIGAITYIAAITGIFRLNMIKEIKEFITF